MKWQSNDEVTTLAQIAMRENAAKTKLSFKKNSTENRRIHKAFSLSIFHDSLVFSHARSVFVLQLEAVSRAMCRELVYNCCSISASSEKRELVMCSCCCSSRGLAPYAMVAGMAPIRQLLGSWSFWILDTVGLKAPHNEYHFGKFIYFVNRWF